MDFTIQFKRKAVSFIVLYVGQITIWWIKQTSSKELKTIKIEKFVVNTYGDKSYIHYMNNEQLEVTTGDVPKRKLIQLYCY